MKNRPKIGITGPNKGGDMAWFFTALAIITAGGIPVRIRPAFPKRNTRLHGLIIGGGADIDAETYQTKDLLDDYLNRTIKNKQMGWFRRIISFFKFLYFPLLFILRLLFSRKGHATDKERDQLEFKLLQEAIEKRLPVLGICRGMQLINVMFEGSLFEDIKTYYEEEPYKQSVLPFKEVIMEEDSNLFRVFRETQFFINGLHHQAIDKLGRDLRIVARERNQIVQAIESSRNQIIYGVQWHPEYLFYRKLHFRLFREIVTRSGQHKSTK